MVRRTIALAAVLVALAGCVLLTGCSRTGPAGPSDPATTATGAGAPPTADATAPAPDAGPACIPSGTAVPAGAATVNLSLPCLTGGQPVRLAALGRPAVVNLWASWCAPCRKELPALQRLAAKANDAVAVLGVVTDDTAAAARSFVDDLGLTFPMLYDKDGQLKQATGKVALPVTVFLDAAGRAAGVYNGPALDDAALRDLTARLLGVTISP
jgi:thiol-disulfide isomerase/thioredoxin